MAKEITLEELANSSTTNKSVNNSAKDSVEHVPMSTNSSSINSVKPISNSTIVNNLKKNHAEELKARETEITDAPLVAAAFQSMDKTLKEKKEFIENEVVPIVMQNAQELAVEKELEDIGITDDEDEISEDIETPKDEESIDSYNADVDLSIDEDDIDKKTETKKEVETEDEDDIDSSSDLDELLNDLDNSDTEIVDDEDETSEELRERFKKSLDSIKVTKDVIDINKFTISKEPVNASSVLSSISTNRNNKKCDWALYATGRSMRFEECKGSELDTLKKTINASNGVNGVIASLKFIYDHVVDANKPSFEKWTKLIRTEDIESMYFGMYMACYSDANLVARVCRDDACDKTSLIDTPIRDMVKYEDDDVKKKFEALLSSDTTTSSTKVKSEMLIISDDIAISYTQPTLYSTFIQYASLKEEITKKYSEYLNTMAYIDGFFKIDKANHTFIPITIKEYPHNINKTVITKLKTYTSILKTLTNDQYNIMTAKLNNIIEVPKVTYIYPETKCPECGATMEEEPIDSMLNLLFTRAQLVQVKSL